VGHTDITARLLHEAEYLADDDVRINKQIGEVFIVKIIIALSELNYKQRHF
jgi:hypothetical protein